MPRRATDGRKYPWGNEWDASAVPTPKGPRQCASLTNVDAYPKGASPFGVMDLVGNVWQWTDEFVDEHTRAGILRGGSYYAPQGSLWYFPHAYTTTEHGKYLAHGSQQRSLWHAGLPLRCRSGVKGTASGASERFPLPWDGTDGAAGRHFEESLSCLSWSALCI